MIPRTAFSDTPVPSVALIPRYPYLPLDAANASAASVPSPAYPSTLSPAWRQWWPPVCFVKFLWAVSAFLLVRLSGCF